MINQKLIEKVCSLTYIGRGYHAYDVSVELKDKAIDVLNYLLKNEIPPLSDIKAHGDGDIWLNWITEDDEYTFSFVIDSDGYYRIYCDPYIDLFVPLVKATQKFAMEQESFRVQYSLTFRGFKVNE